MLLTAFTVPTGVGTASAAFGVVIGLLHGGYADRTGARALAEVVVVLPAHGHHAGWRSGSSRQYPVGDAAAPGSGWCAVSSSEASRSGLSADADTVP
ncbi:hypothetical protein ACU686_34425 [Yinghuangia aomiensis]